MRHIRARETVRQAIGTHSPHRMFLLALLAGTCSCHSILDLGQFDGATLKPHAPSDAATLDADAGAKSDASSGKPDTSDPSDFPGPDASDDSSSQDDAHDASRDSSDDAPAEATDAFDASPATVCDDGKPSWCSQLNPKPKFCHDFSSTEIAASWTRMTMKKCRPVLSASDFTSALCSLSTQTPALIDSETASCHFLDILDYYPDHLRVEFDFKIISRSPDDKVNLECVRFGLWPNDWSLALQFEGNSAYLQEIENSNGVINYMEDHPLPEIPGQNKWTRIAIDLRINRGDAGKSKLSVSLDGTTVMADEPISPVLPPINETEITFGSNYLVGPSGPTNFLLDNAAVYAEP